MKILKFRQKFSYGYGDWEYTDDYTDPETLSEVLEKEYMWSEHYRGCDIEEVDAPKEFFEYRIGELKAQISWREKLIKKYEKKLLA